MSLLADPDYIVHHLRVSLVNNFPEGGRLLSLPPPNPNEYIVAGYTDANFGQQQQDQQPNSAAAGTANLPSNLKHQQYEDLFVFRKDILSPYKFKSIPKTPNYNQQKQQQHLHNPSTYNFRPAPFLPQDSNLSAISNFSNGLMGSNSDLSNALAAVGGGGGVGSVGDNNNSKIPGMERQYSSPFSSFRQPKPLPSKSTSTSTTSIEAIPNDAAASSSLHHNQANSSHHTNPSQVPMSHPSVPESMHNTPASASGTRKSTKRRSVLINHLENKIEVVEGDFKSFASGAAADPNTQIVELDDSDDEEERMQVRKKGKGKKHIDKVDEENDQEGKNEPNGADDDDDEEEEEDMRSIRSGASSINIEAYEQDQANADTTVVSNGENAQEDQNGKTFAENGEGEGEQEEGTEEEVEEEEVSKEELLEQERIQLQRLLFAKKNLQPLQVFLDAPPLFPGMESSRRYRGPIPVVNAPVKPNSESDVKVPSKSALGGMIAAKRGNKNPFAAEFAAFAGKGEPNAICLKLFLPFHNPPTKPITIYVKPTATVDDVIGVALFQYEEEKKQPPIPAHLRNVACFNLRIVDDGEIDEDFPALERTRKISKFGFDQFALSEATPEQKKQNEALRMGLKSVPLAATIPSRGVSTMSIPLPSAASASQPLNSQAGMPTPQSPAVVTSNSTYAPSPTTPSGSGSSAIPATPGSGTTVFLRVNLYSTLEVKQTTTIGVSSNMRMSEIFDLICKKRKYDINHYVLKMADTKTDVPMDKRLDELGVAEVCVLKKDRGGAGDIFLRPPEEVASEELSMAKQRQREMSVASMGEFTSNTYKQYHVTQKLFVGRQDRHLTIDGDYIHIVPLESRNIFDSMRTSTYHVGSVIYCKPYKKGAPNFKLSVGKGSDVKTFELEAASGAEALEICNRIQFLIMKNKPQ